MSDPFKWRHYEGEIILTCDHWYLRYALSYCDLEEMMTERRSRREYPFGAAAQLVVRSHSPAYDVKSEGGES